MGLLARAEKDLEAAKARPGHGLFARATKALAEAGPPITRAPAFDVSMVEALAAEIRALPRSYDVDLAAFSRIAEGLHLDGLALFFTRDHDLVLAAVHGPAFSRKATSLALADLLPYIGERGLLPSQAAAKLGKFLVEDAPSPIYIHPSAPAAAGGACLWMAASSSFTAEAGMGGAFSSLLGYAPRPPVEAKTPRILSPKAAAESIKLGSGKAALHRLDFGRDFSFLKKNATESLLSFSSALVVTAAQALVGEDGRAYLLENGRLAVLSYSRRETDIELSQTQFLKSFRRALPFLFSSGLPATASTSLDCSLASALETFERFVSE